MRSSTLLSDKNNKDEDVLPMHGKIFHSKYKDLRAVTLESAALKVQFAPEAGGKMVSLADKKTAFFAQRANTHGL